MFELIPVIAEGRWKIYQNGGGVTDQDVETMVRNYPDLVEVHLAQSWAGLKAVEALVTLAHLEKLSLSDDLNIGNEEAKILAAHPTVSFLDLSGTAVENDGAEALAKGCPELKVIGLLNTTTKIDYNIVRMFKARKVQVII